MMITDVNDDRPYVLITGASSGVGRATAILLSTRYNLVLHGRNDERLRETASKCAPSADIKLWQFDLSVVERIEDSFTKFLTASGVRIYGLVHSAGCITTLPLRSLSLSKMQEIMNVNFFSAAMISKILIKKKCNFDELRNIVFISSNISNRGSKAFSAYAASKGALDSLMRCLAVELAPRVRVNSVLPGGMKTEMTYQIYQDRELVQRMETTYPLGMGSPEKIASVIDFLLSDKSRWITGQQLTVDGGRTIDITG